MATRYTIPNRPEGRARRSISEQLANFDEILTAINAFDGGNIRRETIVREALAQSPIVNIRSTGEIETEVVNGVIRDMTVNLPALAGSTAILGNFSGTVRLPTNVETVCRIGFYLDEVLQRTWTFERSNRGRQIVSVSDVIVPRETSRRLDVRVSETFYEAGARWVASNRVMNATVFYR